MIFSHEINVLGIFVRSLLSESKTSLPHCCYVESTAPQIRVLNTLTEILQAESVRDAAFGCDWVGTPIPFQRCLIFIITTANKQFQLTAEKFVPVSNVTTLKVCT